MDKNEYILNLENLITNRIKFHSPRLQEEVDYSLLDAVGIDGSYPIFIFNKPMDKLFYKAFFNVKKKVDFNLILTQKPNISKRKLRSLSRTYLFFQEEMCSKIGWTLEQLNINYISHTNFKYDYKNEKLKINDIDIDFDYTPYQYSKKIINKGVISDIKCFILNGKNYLINFINPSNCRQKVTFQFFLPLPRGYYYFKRQPHCILIENLTSKEKAYFNYNFKNCDISFSTVDGIESCTYSCINALCSIELLPKESKKIYFNFGENKYCLFNPNDINYFYELSQKKMNEIFDMKVTTREGKFDEQFNKILPRNIWEHWAKFSIDEESENEYLKMSNQLIHKGENGIQVSKEFKGLKEVKFYRNNIWKRVFIVHNNTNYLFADRVKYFNFTLLTKEIFDKNNEVYLSFDQ